MGEPVKAFASRFRRNLVATGLLACVALVLHAALSTTLTNEDFFTGWLLTGSLGVLALYNVRRRLPFLPLGSSSEWLQFHAYVGIVAVVLFFLHVGFTVPTGILDLTLAIGFTLVAGSGIVGLTLARRLPQRLARRGEEVLYDRIPIFRHRLMERAKILALRAVEETGSSTIADYYADRLRPFFDSPRNFIEHAMEVTRSRHKLLDEMRDLERYLNDNEKAILGEIADLARTKDDLDYQYTLQTLMRRWQFLHVPCTYALILLVLLHIVVVHAFA